MRRGKRLVDMTIEMGRERRRDCSFEGRPLWRTTISFDLHIASWISNFRRISFSSVNFKVHCPRSAIVVHFYRVIILWHRFLWSVIMIALIASSNAPSMRLKSHLSDFDGEAFPLMNNRCKIIKFFIENLKIMRLW